MELLRYLVVLRNRWKVVAGAVLVAMAAAWFLTPRSHVYKATSTLYIGSRSIDLKNATEAFGQVATLDRFIKTFADMIDSAPVAARAVQRAGVERSAESVVKATRTYQVGGASNAAGTGGTQLLAIEVTDRDPVVARNLANAMADSFVEEVQTFEPASTPAAEGTIPTLPAYVFEQARLPLVPQSSGLKLNLVVAGLLGLGLSVGAVLLEDYLDITVRGIEDVERRLDLPVLGAIPELSGLSSVGASRPRRERQPQAIV